MKYLVLININWNMSLWNDAVYIVIKALFCIDEYDIIQLAYTMRVPDFWQRWHIKTWPRMFGSVNWFVAWPNKDVLIFRTSTIVGIRVEAQYLLARRWKGHQANFCVIMLIMWAVLTSSLNDIYNTLLHYTMLQRYPHNEAYCITWLYMI